MGRSASTLFLGSVVPIPSPIRVCRWAGDVVRFRAESRHDKSGKQARIDSRGTTVVARAFLCLLTISLALTGCTIPPLCRTDVCEECQASSCPSGATIDGSTQQFVSANRLQQLGESAAADVDGYWEPYADDSDSAELDPVDPAQMDPTGRTGELTEGQLPRPAVTSSEDLPLIEEPKITLLDVVASIHSTFPLLQAAFEATTIADGNHMAAWGAFDAKFKTANEGGPLGFYETYRNSAGLSQPMFRGGELFGGYRVGRGSFQPWYQERQTNDGGEFKAGASFPLVRNREIDARRARLWRADYDRQIVEPEIRAQLIQFVREGSIAYWGWVAAGQQYDIGKRALILAEKRNLQLKRRVETGDLDPPVLQDNLRAIASRESKLIDLRRKWQQAAVKLSLFYRTVEGCPIVPDRDQLVIFPEPTEVSEDQFEVDIGVALAQRPELTALTLLAQRVNVDLDEARNDMLPAIDARIVGSQDAGEPTSKKRDKSPFELEVGIFVDVPIQRRKARGKTLAASGKLAQISAKRQFSEDKIAAELRSAHVALAAAFERLDKARESKRLAEYMAEVERRKFSLGESSLLSVVLREQYAVEAADSEVEALLEYFTARADYDAAMAN